jgi:RNA recognition motif-containing protein
MVVRISRYKLLFLFLKVKDVRLPRETDNGRLKGFGYAEFDDIDVFLRALTLDDQVWKFLLTG